MTLIMPRCVFLVALFMLSQLGVAQDKVIFLNKQTINGKVKEVGLDSVIVLTNGKENGKPVNIAKSRISYIEYENGERHFVKHDLITLINGNLIIADIKETSGTEILFDNLQTKSARIKHLPLGKVLSILPKRGDEIYFFDKINLRKGGFLAGEVLEISKEIVTYKKASKIKVTEKLEVSKIKDIVFKNGYRQSFVKVEN